MSDNNEIDQSQWVGEDEVVCPACGADRESDHAEGCPVEADRRAAEAWEEGQ
jgi:hypothetical protein